MGCCGIRRCVTTCLGESRLVCQLASILILSALTPVNPATAAFKYLKPGMEAADFTLQTLDDQELTLTRLKEGPATLLQANRPEETTPFLEKALALDGAFTPAVTGRARVLARQGRSAEALALFAAAIELNPRDAAVLAGRAECREAEGNLAEATKDYRSALEVLLKVR